MIICDSPIVIKRYEFLYRHLDCDCIADTSDEPESGHIRILAYSEKKEDNEGLENYFFNQGYSGKYKILQNISSEEVNCIE